MKEYGGIMHLAIVEDEKEYAVTLKSYLQQYNKENISKVKYSFFKDGVSFLDNYKGQFDIILLDISMPYMNGMEVARKIREEDREVIIIFVTNFSHYAIRGYEVNAFDYVLKPVSYFNFCNRLTWAINRAESNKKKYLVLKAREGVIKIDINHIFYVESYNHDLLFHTDKGIFTLGGTMKTIEEYLKEYSFFRCNKSYLVSLRHIESIQDNTVFVADEKLIVSRNKKNELMKALADYLGGSVV